MQHEPRAPAEPAAEPDLDSAGPTRELRPRDQLEFGAQVATDDLLKASLLAGTGAKIGRFHVLRLLGEGGMGMVFAAYDDELDRKVAIKLLRVLPGEGSVGRSRLLREAQALARLSHPNVVAVYEVGEHERQVFIAMEFVVGETLQQWLRGGPRPWREVVRIFIAAGRGLAVAHAAEILHRDFKPANVLIGADGRVRVLDFGLAVAQDRPATDLDRIRLSPSASASFSSLHGSLTEAGSVLGTPAYMAPERLVPGEPVDARADQFSFCVALHEGLYGARPFAGRHYPELRDAILAGVVPEPPRKTRVPRFVRRALLRGLAVIPGERFATMDALLAALDLEPERRRRNLRASLGVATVLLAGGFALAQATTTGPTLCADPRERLAWPGQRAAVEQAFTATHLGYADDTWTRVAGHLDAYVDTWAAGHVEACQSHARGEQSAALLDLRMACLERRRDELGSLLARLVEADADTVRAATAAVDALPSPTLCADEQALTAAIPLPEDPAAAAQVVALRGRLADARAAVSTRKLAAADAIVAEVSAAAEGLNYLPLTAELLVVRGELEDIHGQYEASLATYTEALWLADTVRDDDTLTKAMGGVIGANDRLARYDEAIGLRRHADAVIARLGTGSRGHARLLRSFWTPLLRTGDEDAAAEVARQALEYDRARPDPEPRAIAADLVGLGTVEAVRGNFEAGKRLLTEALALTEQLDGPDHPDVAGVANNLALAYSSLGEYPAARALYERSVRINEAALGPDHPEVSLSLTNLGGALGQAGDIEGARKLIERSLAIDERTLGPDHPELTLELHFLTTTAIEQHDLPTARKYITRALTIREKTFGPDSQMASISRAELGYVLFLQGKLPAAIRELERAIAGIERDPDPGYPEGLHETRFTLAQALRGLGKRAQATAMARQALAGMLEHDHERNKESIAAMRDFLAPGKRGKRRG